MCDLEVLACEQRPDTMFVTENWIKSATPDDFFFYKHVHAPLVGVIYWSLLYLQNKILLQMLNLLNH